MKRKTKQRTPEERAESQARAEEQIRTLRELITKGRAELEAWRQQQSA